MTSSIPILESGDFSGEIKPEIHPLAHSRELFEIYRLTYTCYLATANPARPDGLWIPHANFDHIPETTILVAELDKEIVGSVSITIDGLKGLPMDREFPRNCML